MDQQAEKQSSGNHSSLTAKKLKRSKNKWEQLDDMKYTNICTIGFP